MTEDSLLSRCVYITASIAEREQRGPRDRELSWSMKAGLSYESQDQAVLYTAADLADQVGQSAAVLTRSLKKLQLAGILRPQKGPGGGWALARPAPSITVYNVYQALYDADQHPVRGAPAAGLDQANCPVRQGVARKLDQAYRDMAEACRVVMSAITISDVITESQYGLDAFFHALRPLEA